MLKFSRVIERRQHSVTFDERPATMLKLSASTTALILVDLQKGVVGLPLEPYDGNTVLQRG